MCWLKALAPVEDTLEEEDDTAGLDVLVVVLLERDGALAETSTGVSRCFLAD